MPRPERTINPETLGNIPLGAQEFHEALLARGSVIVRKSGAFPDETFTGIFDYMGTQSVSEAFMTPQGKQILYLPIHLDANATTLLARKQGLPAFNLRLAQLASTVPTWVDRDIRDRASRHNVPEEPDAQDDNQAAILSRLRHEEQFRTTSFSVHVIRDILKLFGNPPKAYEPPNTPMIVPIFNCTFRLPANFADILQQYNPSDPSTNDETNTPQVSQALVELAHYLSQSYGSRIPTQYILVADLRPYDVITDHYDQTVEPWLGWGPNEDLLHEYRSMKVVQI